MSKKENVRNMDKYEYFYNILSKSNYKPLFKKDEYTKDQNYDFIHKKCNTQFNYPLQLNKIPICPKCQPKKSENYLNELSKFISKYDNNIIQNHIIDNHTIDIFLPNYNLAIDINYLYYYTDRNGFGRNYFIDIKKNLLKNDISYFNIMEDELMSTPNIIKSMILNKMKKLPKTIYARNCKPGITSNSKAKQFLENNHLQGNLHSKYNFGLYHKTELVSLLTMGYSRYNENYEYEIHRFSSKLGYNVPGGFSKLLKFAIQKLNSTKIITYVDLRHGTGNVYKISGFNYLNYSYPNYFYVNNYKRQSRVQYQKHKLKDKLDFFDGNLTEWENMQINDFDRIWDCGNSVFAL